MFARVQRIGHHREVQRVRRAHVDHIHLRIVQDLVIIAGGFVDVKLLAQPPGLLLLAFADGVNLYESQAANPSKCTRPTNPVPKTAAFNRCIIMTSFPKRLM